MEFLRLGSSIPGSYWGCCAVCVIQNFKVDPDAKASIQLVSGDGGNPILDPSNNHLYAGPTWKDIFLQRLRYGTFGKGDMPNHTFLAVLTAEQIAGDYGSRWLALLKQQGFEFIRTVDNSVYTGESLATPGIEYGASDEDYYNEEEEDTMSSHPNYIFGLFRNVGKGKITDPFLPPAAWTNLPDPVGTDVDIYKKLPKDVFYTEKQLEDMGVPITYAGKRSKYPQEPKIIREARDKLPVPTKKAASAPWG